MACPEMHMGIVTNKLVRVMWRVLHGLRAVQ